MLTVSLLAKVIILTASILTIKSLTPNHVKLSFSIGKKDYKYSDLDSDTILVSHENAVEAVDKKLSERTECDHSSLEITSSSPIEEIETPDSKSNSFNENEYVVCDSENENFDKNSSEPFELVDVDDERVLFEEEKELFKKACLELKINDEKDLIEEENDFIEKENNEEQKDLIEKENNHNEKELTEEENDFIEKELNEEQKELLKDALLELKEDSLELNKSSELSNTKSEDKAFISSQFIDNSLYKTNFSPLNKKVSENSFESSLSKGNSIYSSLFKFIMANEFTSYNLYKHFPYLLKLSPSQLQEIKMVVKSKFENQKNCSYVDHCSNTKDYFYLLLKLHGTKNPLIQSIPDYFYSELLKYIDRLIFEQHFIFNTKQKEEFRKTYYYRSLIELSKKKEFSTEDFYFFGFDKMNLEQLKLFESKILKYMVDRYYKRRVEKDIEAFGKPEYHRIVQLRLLLALYTDSNIFNIKLFKLILDSIDYFSDKIENRFRENLKSSTYSKL